MFSHSHTEPLLLKNRGGYSVSNRNLEDISCALLYLVRIDPRPGLLSPAQQFPETVVSDATERQAVTDPASRLPI